MSVRWVAIVNPAAGGGRCGARAATSLAALRARGLPLEEVRTTGPGDAVTRVRDLARQGVARFVAVGGDGTAFEVVNGLFGPGAPTWTSRPVLGILPLGTGNSFLRDFSIRDEASALDALARRATRACDVLRIAHDGGETYSLNLVGVGFTAVAGALTNRRFKRLGAAGYVLAVVQTTLALEAPVFPLRIDGGARDERPAILLSFCNSRCTAGAMQMAPHADPSDGQLDVIRVGPRSRLAFLRAFPSIFRGTHVTLPGIEESRARRVDFDLDAPLDCMIDGEVRRLRPTSIEVVPSALEIVS
jgi:YegS/Rv2252/BmrU family lipid kinase